MRINEVEERLGVAKANIRFYENQGLVNPTRAANGYREYSEEDVLQLQSVLVLRKLGVSVEDIRKMQDEEMNLQDVIARNIANLEQEIQQLQGALRVSRQIAEEGKDSLDAQKYWDIIQTGEASGESFADIAEDFWVNHFFPLFQKRFSYVDAKFVIPVALLMNTVWAIARSLLRKEGSFIGNFLYWPVILLVCFAILFPIFWLGKKHPKAAAVLYRILMTICIGFFAFIALIFLGYLVKPILGM